MELGKEEVNMEKHLTKDKIENIWEKYLRNRKKLQLKC